jgi:transcriptional regulator with XRE-family HTH domain
MLTPAQLRAARAIIGWSRARLAKESKTGAETVKNFEIRGSDPKRSTMLAWRTALQKAGVTFLDEDMQDGPGVRLRKDAPKRA